MKKATLQTVARDVTAIARSVRMLEKRALGKQSALKLVPSNRPELATGEKYAGIILGKNNALDYHLIKLPGEMPQKGGWTAAGEWVKDLVKKIAGAALPNRREQALMYANIPEEFQTDDPYWSCEESAGLRHYAWYQWFDNGRQGHWSKGYKYRACAVRRVPI